MKTMVSQINTVGLDPNRSREIMEAARQKLVSQREKTVPTIGLVSNFDPDIREFLTTPWKGFTSVQIGANGGGGIYGALAVQADYTPAITAAQAEALGMEDAERERLNRKRAVPRLGYPALVYPVPAQGPGVNTNFIRGGRSVDLERAYPIKHLTKAWTSYEFGDVSDPGLHITYRIDSTIVTRTDAAGTPTDIWDQNSPLPPGVRYYELQDLLGMTQTGIGALPIQPGSPAPVGVNVEAALMEILHVPDVSILLPRDSLGNIRTNLVPLADEAWWHLGEVYKNDIYWKGEVVDPVTWVGLDSYWQSRGITKAGLEAYLESHPGCKYD